MGQGWGARHPELNTPVALQVLSVGVGVPSARKRFEREAKAAARLAHAHVVRVYDYGVENGSPYLAMELLVGESLEARLNRVGSLRPADASKLLHELARGLSAAHELG